MDVAYERRSGSDTSRSARRIIAVCDGAAGFGARLTGWAFLLPQFSFFVVFLLIPVIGVFWWSTQEGGLTTRSEFVGLDNFPRLPRQVDAIAAIRNTFTFALLSIPIALVLALGIAMLLGRSAGAARSTASWSTSRCSCRAWSPRSSGCS